MKEYSEDPPKIKYIFSDTVRATVLKLPKDMLSDLVSDPIIYRANYNPIFDHTVSGFTYLDYTGGEDNRASIVDVDEFANKKLSNYDYTPLCKHPQLA